MEDQTGNQPSPGRLKDRSWARPPLSIYVAGTLLIMLAIVVAPAVWLATLSMESALVRDQIGDLSKILDGWTERLNDHLLATEASATRYGHLLTEELRSQKGVEPSGFDALVARDPDGGFRSRRDHFDPAREAVIYLPPTYPMNDAERVFVQTAKRLSELYYIDTHAGYMDAWVLPRHGGVIAVWPGGPTYINDLNASVDYANSVWVTMATPANNPEGETRWTPTSYDEAGAMWVISAVAPFQRDGQFAGSVGHDVPVFALVTRIGELLRLAGSDYHLVRGDGKLLVSSVHQARIQESKGTLTLDALGDPELLKAFKDEKGRGRAGAQVLGDAKAARVFIGARIAGPDWYLISVVSRASLLESVQATYRRYWLAGAAALVAMVLLPVLLMTRMLLPAVHRLVTGAERIRGGDLSHHFEVGGSLEFVRIGDALNAMVQRLDASIMAQAATAAENARLNVDLLASNERLEQQVEERTMELRAAKEAADRANKAKSDFLARMSHELRTPLNGVLGYAQILERAPDLSSKSREGVRIIYKSGEHLLGLIRDVLDLAKVEAGKLELTPKPIHLPKFIKMIEALCRVRAEEKGITFNCVQSGPALAGVVVDEQRLTQVLLNLLGNATKFTEQGGVTFRIEVLDEALAPPVGREAVRTVRFCVEDTGPGIDPARLPDIFKPFEQLGDEKARRQGTGLGLAICKSIVECMGGRIEVDSQKGQGSRFAVTLRLPEATAKAETGDDVGWRAITGYEGERRRLLIVDDVPENRAVLRDLLSPIGFELVEAETAEQALHLAALHKPHLILMDLALPGMDGYEATRRLRMITALSQAVVIASSASVSEGHAQKSAEVGCNGFLPKPVEARALFELIGQSLGLKWQREAKEPAAAPVASEAPDLVTLPRPGADDMARLRGLAEKGLIRDLLAELRRLEEQKETPFGLWLSHVRAMAERLQLRELRELFRAQSGADAPPSERAEPGDRSARSGS